MASEKGSGISRVGRFFVGGLVILCFCACSASFGEQPSTTRVRVFTLRHISADKAVSVLNDLSLGTASIPPKGDSLIVTASAIDLHKASTVIKLIDSKMDYVIEELALANHVSNIPKAEQLSNALSDVEVGTFLEFPEGGGFKAIIGEQSGMVLLISPVEKLDEIKAAIKNLQEGVKVSQIARDDITNSNATVVEPNLLSDIEPIKKPVAPEQVDELFDKLMRDVKELKQAEQHKAVEEAMRQEDLAASDVQNEIVELTSSEPNKTNTIEKMNYKPQNIEFADSTLALDLPEKLPLLELLDLAGKYLNLNYMFREEDLAGQMISLRVQGPITVAELYPLLEQTLQFNGFAMTRSNNLVVIRKKENALDIDPRLVSPGQREVEVGDVLITRIFHLKYSNPTSVQNLLAEMKLGEYMKAIPETKTLIVTGYTHRMERIEELIDMVDQPGMPKQFRFRQLKYTMAESLLTKVKALAEQLGTISVAIEAAAEAAPAPGQPPAVRRPAAPQLPQQPQEQSSQPIVYLDADARTNRILMIGQPDQLAIVDGLIQSLDIEKQDLRRLKLYEIQHVGPEEVYDKLLQLGVISKQLESDMDQSRGYGTSQRRTTTTRVPAQPGQPQPIDGRITSEEGTDMKPLSEEPQIVIVDASSSLLVNATPEQHATIANIIGYVDSEQLEKGINYVVYPLENQDPGQLKTLLEDLIKKTVTEESQAQLQTEGTKIQRTRTTTARKSEEEVTIVADPNTYSLVVYASKKNHVWIKSLIDQLDEYRPQVLLDVTLVAISRDDEFKFDLDILTKYPSFGEVPSTDTQNGLLTPLGPLGGRYIEAASNSGEGTFFYSDGQVQALLSAFKKRNYGRVLSRPKLLVNDNQEGIIKQERTIYITETNVIVVPSTTTQTTQTDVKFTPYTTGIDLAIRPHISKGNQLRLNIDLKRDDFDSDPILVPVEGRTVQKPANERSNNIKTTVTVPDNYTVILGGIETINQSKTGSKIPILGDIPLIGGLFNSINNNDEQVKLYIFVKAQILRPTQNVDDRTDIVRVSRQNRRSFEELETEFQKKQDWPGLDAEVMDPLSVLDEDVVNRY